MTPREVMKKLSSSSVDDCPAIRPADEIDPEYGRTLRQSVKAGVEVLANRARVTERAISLGKAVPLQL